MRVANSGVIDERKGSFFKMDQKKKQVTLLEPDNKEARGETTGLDGEEEESSKRRVDVSAPKMFAFDGLFTDEDGQNELSSSALTDILHSVLGGSDGTLFCFGHANLGKSYTMVGSDESSRYVPSEKKIKILLTSQNNLFCINFQYWTMLRTIGIIPTAIAWLFKCIKERKEKTRTSVRVSSCEIVGTSEEMRDLLAGVTEGDQESGRNEQ